MNLKADICIIILISNIKIKSKYCESELSRLLKLFNNSIIQLENNFELILISRVTRYVGSRIKVKTAKIYGRYNLGI